MIPNWLTGFPYSVMHSLNLDWLLKKVASIDPSRFVRSINNTLTPDPETGNLNLTAGDVGALGVYGTANNSLLLDGKPSAYYLTPVNLLDNSNFANPVNQHGYVSGTIGSNNYSIDRWKLQYETSLVLADGYVTLGGKYDIRQIVSSKLKAGTVYTLAAKMRASGGARNLWIVAEDSDGNSLAIKAVYNNGEWVTITTTFTTTSVLENISVYVTNSNDPTVNTDIEWIALYEGSCIEETLPPYVPKPYTVELAECQRYYLPLIQTPVGFGYVFNNVAVINVPLPQPMRAIPSIADGLTFYIIQTNGNTLSSTSYSISGMSGNALQLNVVLSDAVENSPVIAFTNNFALNLDL